VKARKIVVIAEGKTEGAFGRFLRDFVQARCHREGKPCVRLQTETMRGTLTNYGKLRQKALVALKDREVVGVIALTDVYDKFKTAGHARTTLGQHLPSDPCVHAHCALHDFEAWLLPYWEKIHHRAGRPVPRHNPWPSPERIDLLRPPSVVLGELYPQGQYDKVREAQAILQDEDLTLAADACPELKALLNTILMCASLEPLA
jgi:hypothetical protein